MVATMAMVFVTRGGARGLRRRRARRAHAVRKALCDGIAGCIIEAIAARRY